MTKKVLIITYYWPPSGGGGVQRWLKFAKYFRDFGWEPVIYTPSNPEMPAIDPSLEKEIPKGIIVIKQPVWEPYTLYKKFTGKKKKSRINTGFLAEDEKPKITEKLSVWVRGNLFIPDARKFWIKPSIKYLKKYLKENPVEAMVSTGTPHSMHLIALGIKKSMNLPWIADFRDPWTNIDFYPKLKLTKWADKKHRKLEKEVMLTADELVTVSWNWAEDFKKLSGRTVNVITNGFDNEDFQFDFRNRKMDKSFSLLHIGAMNSDRNPVNLWRVLGEMVKTVPGFKDDLEIKLIGSNDVAVINDLKRNGLDSFTRTIDYLPHNEVIQQTVSAHLMLLPLNDTPDVSGRIPGKLFEYLAARRPVLCIGPDDGDSARIISETGAGRTFSFDADPEIRDYLTEQYQVFKNGYSETEAGKIESFERKNLTKRMGQVLNSCIVSPQVSG